MGKSQSNRLLIRVFQGQEELAEHVVGGDKNVTIGRSPSNTLHTPGPTTPESCRLFVYREGSYHLLLDENRTGHIAIAGQWTNINTLWSSPHVRLDGTDLLLALDEESVGAILWENYTFSFQFVDMPPLESMPLLPPRSETTKSPSPKVNRGYVLALVLVVLGLSPHLSNLLIASEIDVSPQTNGTVIPQTQECNESVAPEPDRGDTETDTVSPNQNAPFLCGSYFLRRSSDGPNTATGTPVGKP